MNAGESEQRKVLGKWYPVGYLPDEKRNEIIDRIEQFPSITISGHAWSVIVGLAAGKHGSSSGIAGKDACMTAFDPDMEGRDSTYRKSTLLPADEEDLEGIAIPADAILRDVNGKNIALIHLVEKFKVERAGYPGLPGGSEEGNTAIAGPVEIVRTEIKPEDRENITPGLAGAKRTAAV